LSCQLGVVAHRDSDSKHPDGPQLAFAANTWKTFTDQLKATA
jgi:hypothetical protein